MQSCRRLADGVADQSGSINESILICYFNRISCHSDCQTRTSPVSGSCSEMEMEMEVETEMEMEMQT